MNRFRLVPIISSLSLVVSRPKQAASCFPWLPVAPHLPPPNLPPNSCQKFQSPRGYLISLHLVSLASHHVSSDGVSRGSVRIFIFMLFFIEARHTDAVFFLPEVRFQFVVWNWILPPIYHPPTRRYWVELWVEKSRTKSDVYSYCITPINGWVLSCGFFCWRKYVALIFTLFQKYK